MRLLIALLTLALSAAVGQAAGYTDAVTGMEFVLVKGGCYQMGNTFAGGSGNEKPVHKVCVDDFYVGKFEVTQAQYQKVMGKNPAAFKGCGLSCPVDSVSWEDAQEFIRKLNAGSGKNFRLPYEAEWEYAARSGGRNEQYAGTSDLERLGDYAWYEANSSDKTHEVGTRKPNGLGIYDMSGSLWEWCADWYDENYYANSPEENPSGALAGSNRVSRGGSWSSSAEDLRTAVRSGDVPGSQNNDNGFRLAFPAQ
ncbi:serine/threonine-protein kinase pkn1 [Geobacter sp. OR-1]|uniref:formylglycine-generating enzyme family protein n=1 Tax=Geobacter sp. OR-1 TaxID=1266765 RepID=UPI0005434ACE|nr:formylglycine-generating enzyme family protein [Geobacter sp. OR-1]GAM09443.1 serine/threonine-protein kinase pkn1 [Geobacter sp. OR-1]